MLQNPCSSQCKKKITTDYVYRGLGRAKGREKRKSSWLQKPGWKRFLFYLFAFCFGGSTGSLLAQCSKIVNDSAQGTMWYLQTKIRFLHAKHTQHFQLSLCSRMRFLQLCFSVVIIKKKLPSNVQCMWLYTGWTNLTVSLAVKAMALNYYRVFELLKGYRNIRYIDFFLLLSLEKLEESREITSSREITCFGSC